MSPNVILGRIDTLVVLSSFVCLLVAMHHRRREQMARHRFWISIALVLQTAFLALFVFRFVRFGHSPIEAPPLLIAGFRVLLIAHESLAVICVPLVIITYVLSYLPGRWFSHVAQTAYPLWLIVTGSGLVIGWVLYFT